MKTNSMNKQNVNGVLVINVICYYMLPKPNGNCKQTHPEKMIISSNHAGYLIALILNVVKN